MKQNRNMPARETGRATLVKLDDETDFLRWKAVILMALARRTRDRTPPETTQRDPLTPPAVSSF